MAKYKDASGNIIEVGDPSLNPSLIAGKTLVPDTTNISTGAPIITSDLMKPQTAFNPTQPTPTSYTPASTADATVPKPTEPTLGTTETELSTLIRELMAGNTANTGQTAFEAEQRKAEGVSDLIKAQDDISSQILMLQAEDKNVEAQMQKESEGRGITVGGLAPHSAAARRDLGIRANILSAQLAASQGKLASANARIAQAVKDKFGPQEEEQKARIANLELLLKDPNLTLEEKNRANAQLLIQKQKETEIAQKKVDQADVWKVATDASANSSNFTPTAEYPNLATTLKAISEAPTKEQALAISSATGLTQKKAEWSEPYMLGGDLVQKNQQTGEIRTAVNISGKAGGGDSATILAGLTPEQQKDPFIQKLVASAGGKPLTDTPIQQLTKGINVLGQLGVLEANIKNTSTGPIAGLFRGANPWDTNAQTIKAQLNAIVPNLARGIYGEVGVLTDNDIQTYAKTLPNLTSTEAIRNAVLGITVDLIGKSIKKTLEVNAAAGRDVSGFVDLYTEMQATRDSIFAQIPGYKGAGTQSLQSLGVSKAEEDLFDSVVGTGDTSSGGMGGFFSNIWKGLTGQ